VYELSIYSNFIFVSAVCLRYLYLASVEKSRTLNEMFMLGMYVTGGRITGSHWACWSMPNSINRRWWRRPRSCLVTVKLMIRLWRLCKVTYSISFARCPSLECTTDFFGELQQKAKKCSGLLGKSGCQT